MERLPASRALRNRRDYAKLRISAWLFTFASALVISLLIYMFVIREVRVNGSSMEPTLREGEVLIVNRLSVYMRRVRRGEIVIFMNGSTSEEFIKRVVGLPGERVEIRGGSVYINGVYLDESDYLAFAEGELEEVSVPEGHVFLLGDNRAVSLDSRDASVGCVPLTALDGSVIVRILPIEDLTIFL
jgi:signal peptidase I